MSELSVALIVSLLTILSMVLCFVNGIPGIVFAGVGVVAGLLFTESTRKSRAFLTGLCFTAITAAWLALALIGLHLGQLHFV